jgi:hypothetical protein
MADPIAAPAVHAEFAEISRTSPGARYCPFTFDPSGDAPTRVVFPQSAAVPTKAPLPTRSPATLDPKTPGFLGCTGAEGSTGIGNCAASCSRSWDRFRTGWTASAVEEAAKLATKEMTLIVFRISRETPGGVTTFIQCLYIASNQRFGLRISALTLTLGIPTVSVVDHR